MGKNAITKRLSTTSQPISKSIDVKARRRIEELYELTDEIINAYNEINDKYVHQIYRKYQRLKEKNHLLQQQASKHHCQGCQCQPTSKDNDASDNSTDYDDTTKTTAAQSSTTNSVITRSKKNNPFIISDVEETQKFDANDSRFRNNLSDDDQDKMSIEKNSNTSKLSADNNDSDYEEEEDDDDDDQDGVDGNGRIRLPLALRQIIERKATKNQNAKAYLLEIPRYHALCEYLRDKSAALFDHRPTEEQVRPLIINHISPNVKLDGKARMRIRDELREIHRSYLRTFMHDPHGGPHRGTLKAKSNATLVMKKSPL